MIARSLLVAGVVAGTSAALLVQAGTPSTGNGRHSQGGTWSPGPDRTELSGARALVGATSAVCLRSLTSGSLTSGSLLSGSLPAGGRSASTTGGRLLGPAPATPNPGGLGTPAVVGNVNSDCFPFDYGAEVFEVGRDHRVVDWSLAAGQVTSRADLGGYADGDGIAATQNGDDQGLEIVLVRGADGAVWYRQRRGTDQWQGWRSLGGRIVGHPSALRPQVTGASLVVLVRGTNGAMYERTRSPSGWSPRWRRVGGALTSAPAVALSPVGYAAYVLGRDHLMWTAVRGPARTARWSAWRRFLRGIPGGDRPISEPTADPWIPQIYYRNRGGGCSVVGPPGAADAWATGGEFISGIAGVAGALVVGRGPTGRLYYADGGQSWRMLGSARVPG